MSIPRAELWQLVGDLHWLQGAQIQRITQPSQDELVWQIRRPGHTHFLYFNLQPPYERLHLIDSKPPSLPSPSAFCMLLRKKIMGARLTSFQMLEGDRVVRIGLKSREEEHVCIVELLPRQGNILLCDQEQGLLYAAKGLPAFRDLRRGDPYKAPPRREEKKAEAEIEAEIEAPLFETPPTTSQHFDLSSHTEIASTYQDQTEQKRLKQLKQMALKSRRDERKKLKRLIQNLERDLQRCQESLSREQDGELLKGALHQVQRGAAQVEVVNYYDPEMGTKIIPLDPTLNPQQNLEKLFRKIKRARKGIESIEPRLEEAELRQMELEEEVEIIEGLDTVEALQDYLPEKQAQTRRRRAQEQSTPYREYTSIDGHRILVGRNSKGNDELTFRVAKGNDHWLHVRGIPGSHVVIPLKKGSPPSSELLIDAATLAAHFSKARGEIHVDVMHTQSKYVKKPKGAPPGQVSVIRDSNIPLRLEPERLKRLLTPHTEQENAPKTSSKTGV